MIKCFGCGVSFTVQFEEEDADVKFCPHCGQETIDDIQLVEDYSTGITPSLTPGLALTSLIGFITVYAVVYASGFVYIFRTVKKGTDYEEDDVRGSLHDPQYG